MFTLLKSFKTNNKGNAAVIFAIVLAPLLGFVGYAIDYNEASRQKAILQSASDMAALYIAKLDDPDKKQKANTLATDIVKRLAAESHVKNIAITGEIVKNTVKVTATGDNPNSFSRIFGFESVSVGVLSEATYSVPDIEIALVLDVTGSMQDNNKIDEMKLATFNIINLIKTLNENSDNQKTRISLVAFSDEIKASLPLTNDWASLNKTVNSFEANGATAIGLGMSEARNHLKSGEKKIADYMIVLSDGEENTRLDVGMEVTCPLVKADGTNLFMVGMQGAKAAEMTKCAGSPTRYFDASHKGDVEIAFAKIFAEISALRLTK
jgi:Flp pilus assembly protein TadG